MTIFNSYVSLPEGNTFFVFFWLFFLTSIWTWFAKVCFVWVCLDPLRKPSLLESTSRHRFPKAPESDLRQPPCELHHICWYLGHLFLAFNWEKTWENISQVGIIIIYSKNLRDGISGTWWNQKQYDHRVHLIKSCIWGTHWPFVAIHPLENLSLRLVGDVGHFRIFRYQFIGAT